MTKYNPAFWEVNVDPAVLEEVLVDPGDLEQLLHSPEEEQAQAAKAQHKDDAVALILELIQTQLTPRQASGRADVFLRAQDAAGDRGGTGDQPAGGQQTPVWRTAQWPKSRRRAEQIAQIERKSRD